ncbi:MAG: rod shape-determining protein MreC [Candidatus Magasanikbacteria bacterium]|uniref:Cell shape-determining protein MreC n=1 Tax=Candidatus Magasanikbacteria bacterium CG10_big_fil_rev_8_21_14_0_10_38_6 TaxID=1974647 RepID=A0A2M6P0H5_9BACT|nr:rod shape-determining protein MreC [Candidatus Magasanikbacteria bacterium]NCS72292.1 rod shape-determining protein MreC [Candidatus Magasanikbacteria bacterium]PIR77201.1 MAG: rod shape-determining protein MreC [Candidatus Magasanikbacteria bacterium CG10_big_fil_rev_8_21_14_0_10_38_6]
MEKSKLRIIISISAVIFFLITLHYIGWLSPIEHLLRGIVNKGAEPIYQVSVLDNNIETDTHIQIENLTMQLEILQEENQELQKQLLFFSSTPYEHVGAQIIGRNVDPVANTIILNKGETNNISIGNPVITEEGILIGKIAKVEKDTSIVRLLQDGQSKIAATIRNEEKTIGLIEGGYGLSVQMNTIPQNQNVDIGDTVMTSGLEQGIPRGLYIGKISEVQKEAYQPFQEAIVIPAIDSRTLHIVSVITQEALSQ